METVHLAWSSAAQLHSNAASIWTSSDSVKIAFVGNSNQPESGDAESEPCQRLTIATVAKDASWEDVVAQLPADCSRVSWVQGQKPAGHAARDQAVIAAITGKNIGLSVDAAKTLQLRGLAHCWLPPACSERQQPIPADLWHVSPPPCSQQVSHMPSWQRINDRLARRMLRHQGAEDRPLAAIVAELGPREISLHRIDSDLQVTPLVSEKFLGYGNLLGLARLAAATASCIAGGGDSSQQLHRLLDLSAVGSLARLDLTIGDLLPAESAYGHYDVDVAVFTLGKLHDSKSLDELQPSPGDVAASLTYAFIKSFFDTIIHTASAHGIFRVAVMGEFFASECSRSRLFEAWNFTGVSKDALQVQFLRQDHSELLTLVGGLC